MSATCNDAIVSPYADMIYYLEKGKIIDIKEINRLNTDVTKRAEVKRGFGDHIPLALKVLKARSLYNIVYILLSIMIVLSTVLLSNMFTSIKEEDNYTDIFKYGNNIIESRGSMSDSGTGSFDDPIRWS